MKKNNIYQQSMRPWPDLKSLEISINIFDEDLTLFYYEEGIGNPHTMVLIHGLGDEADTWRHVIKPLGEKYHIIALDLPGFGRSDLPEDKITPPFLLNSLSEILRLKNIEATMMVGNSLGGVLAQAYGLTYPEKIEGLVLVDGALLQIEPMGDFGIRLMQTPLLGEWLYKRLRKDPRAAFNSLRNVYHDLDQMPEADREFLFTRVNKRVWSDKQCQAYFSTLRNLTPWIRERQAELPDQLNDFQFPALILRGEHDGLFSEENAKGVVRVQPNATYSVIKDAGHLPHQEMPAEFLSVLRHWLDDNID